MINFAPRWIGIGLAALVFPVVSLAQEAYARGPLNLRAGPSNDYPLVARLRPRQPFDVLGCVRGYRWCDIVLPDGLRGWAWAGNIDYYGDDDRPLPLASYGAIIGVPIVGFAIGNYWGNHYRDRPWYDDRRWWSGGRPPPPVAGWRPAPPERPHWRPHPGRAPGYGPPLPGPGFRPDRRQEFHPPPDRGFRPPRPERDIHPPRPERDNRPPQGARLPRPQPGVQFPQQVQPTRPDRAARPPQAVRPPVQGGAAQPQFANPNGGYVMPGRGRGPTNHELPLGDRP